MVISNILFSFGDLEKKAKYIFKFIIYFKLRKSNLDSISKNLLSEVQKLKKKINISQNCLNWY